MVIDGHDLLLALLQKSVLLALPRAAAGLHASLSPAVFFGHQPQDGRTPADAAGCHLGSTGKSTEGTKGARNDQFGVNH